VGGQSGAWKGTFLGWDRVFDFLAARDPENGQVRRVREELQARLPPGTPVETNVSVVDSSTGLKLTDIDVLVDGKVIVLLKGGRNSGRGQLLQAELFLPIDRNGTPNLLIMETNPDALPVVVYVAHLGPHARRGLESAGINSFGGGANAAQRRAEFQHFLDEIHALITSPPNTPSP
jgi:hypothetical protein